MIIMYLVLQTVPYRHFPQPNGISRYGNPSEDCIVKVNNLTLNPCQKPVELMRWIIRHFSNPSDQVLSLCEGTGTSCIAAAIEGRNIVGVDYLPEMFEGAAMRIRNFLDAEAQQQEILKQNLQKVKTKVYSCSCSVEFVIKCIIYFQAEDEEARRKQRMERTILIANVYEKSLGTEGAAGRPKEELIAEVLEKAADMVRDDTKEIFKHFLHTLSAQALLKLSEKEADDLNLFCANHTRKAMLWKVNCLRRSRNEEPLQIPLRVLPIREGGRGSYMKYKPAEEKYPDGTPEEEVERYRNFMLYGDHIDEFESNM